MSDIKTEAIFVLEQLVENPDSGFPRYGNEGARQGAIEQLLDDGALMEYGNYVRIVIHVANPILRSLRGDRK